MQLNNYQIILSTAEIDLKTERTNCTTKGSEGATLMKAGSLGMLFRGEMDHEYYGREGARVSKKSKRERSTWGNTQKEYFPEAIGLENERG